MKPSKGKVVAPLSASPMGDPSVPVRHMHIPTVSTTAQAPKLKACRKACRGRIPLAMLLDTLNSTSSDEMSFDEEDMCGSDPNEAVVCALPSQSIDAISCV